MKYEWKVDEFAWMIGTAVAVALFQVLADFDPDKIVSFKTWGIAAAAGAVRAGAGAALAFMSRPRSQ